MTLNQGRPFLMLHQPYQRRSALLRVGAELAGSGIGAGLLVSYDNVHARGVAADANKAGQLRPLLADAGWRFGRTTTGRVATANWLARAEPTDSASWDTAVSEAAAAQRALGLDAIMTPAPEIHGAHGRAELQKPLEAARRGFRSRPASDPPWFARLTLRDEWLADARLRTPLLNEISNLPDDLGIALHVRWRKNNPETDDLLLGGLKSFALALAGDDRPLLLLQAGIVGWLSLAWDVAGFSAGLSYASWVDCWRGGGGAKPGQPKPPDIKWFFEPSLLRRFRDDEHDELTAQAGYLACACCFCGVLAGGAAWLPAAQQHGLYCLGQLTDRVASAPRGQRRQAVEAVIRQAENNWQSIIPSAALSPSPRPVHLQTWLGVL